jgi:prevent-host-death family protein
MNGQMKSVPVTEFKARCLSLLEDVARTGEPLLVTKRGKALARVLPDNIGDARSPQETLAGTVTIVGDLREPVQPAEDWAAVRGELLPPRGSRKRRK